MGAAANQLWENETKGSLIDLYLKALDEIREFKATLLAMEYTESEYDGQTLYICPSCGDQQPKHDPDCPILKVKGEKVT